MRNKLNKLPKAAGIAILVICVLLGVTLGNGNALNKAVRRAEKELPAVEQILAERAGKASNLITLCERYIPESDAAAELKEARDDILSAQSAAEMYEANLRLSGLAEAAQIALSTEADQVDQKLLLSAMDELNSSQLQLQRAAKPYNEEIADAQKVYNKLPTRFLHQEPEGFE